MHVCQNSKPVSFSLGWLAVAKLASLSCHAQVFCLSVICGISQMLQLLRSSQSNIWSSFFCPVAPNLGLKGVWVNGLLSDSGAPLSFYFPSLGAARVGHFPSPTSETHMTQPWQHMVDFTSSEVFNDTAISWLQPGFILSTGIDFPHCHVRCFKCSFSTVLIILPTSFYWWHSPSHVVLTDLTAAYVHSM